MRNWIAALDRLLKGEVTRLSALRTGNIDVPLGGLSVMILALGIIYGLCMGAFALVSRWRTPELYMGYEQLAASAVKVPMLFFFTLLVTFPSLYVFNALVGSRLTFATVLRLLIATLGVILAVLASFGTIIVFFSVCTTSYSFMVVLNVIMFAISGFLGLGFLLQTLHRLSLARDWAEQRKEEPPKSLEPTETPVAAPPAVAPEAPAAGDAPRILSHRSTTPGALDRLGSAGVNHNVKLVFQLWVLVFALVGAQMGWVLRPFIGNPHIAFSFFRSRNSNFFESVFEHLRHLIS
jgi:hypothetical protein